jgi:hypothetical protein
MTMPARAEEGTETQSLASGTAGRALLGIERAHNGAGTWDEADAEIRRIGSGPVEAGPHAGLFYGAPAIAFVLHTARADGRPRYQSAVDMLGRRVHRMIRQRLIKADARIRRGDAATFGEYDLFRGLTGFGALLLRTAPGSDTLGSVLEYLVNLTRSTVIDDMEVPGWWVAHDPDPLLPTPGGHANFGMAHGVAVISCVKSLSQVGGHVLREGT